MKAYFREQVVSVRDYYSKDLTAMSEEQLGELLGEAKRCAFDYTYEVSVINRRLAVRIQGGTPPKLEGDGWSFAPAEMRDKESIFAEFNDSVGAFLTAWDALTDEQVASMDGEYAPVKMAAFLCVHAMYHDGQLNLVQAIKGDAEVHW